MPSETTFNSAEEVNTYIQNLRKEGFLDETKLAQEHIVTTNGRTFRVSKILELSDEEAEKYDIKFFVRKKEQPENDEDFAECSLKEFKNSQNKKLFVYNHALATALLTLDKERTINQQRYVYQKVAISRIDAQCLILHENIIFPIITIYSKTYESTALLKYLKTQIDKGIKITDPATHFSGYLPPNKIMPNRALADLIMINHQNFIKNKCMTFLKKLAKQTNTETATLEIKRYIEKYLNDIRSKVEIYKSVENELPQDRKTLEERNKELSKKQSLLEKSKLRQKYSGASHDNHDQLKSDVANINQLNKNNRFRLSTKLYIFFIILFLMIGAGFALRLTNIISDGPFAILEALGVVLGLGGGYVRRVVHHDKLVTYSLAINETDKLLTEIDEIIKLKKAIEFSKPYQTLCESILQFIANLNLINTLEKAISESLPTNSEEKSITPSPAPLSSSDYLLKTSGKKFSKEDKQEEGEKKSVSDEVILTINEETTERSPLIPK